MELINRYMLWYKSRNRLFRSGIIFKSENFNQTSDRQPKVPTNIQELNDIKKRLSIQIFNLEQIPIIQLTKVQYLDIVISNKTTKELNQDIINKKYPWHKVHFIKETNEN